MFLLAFSGGLSHYVLRAIQHSPNITAILCYVLLGPSCAINQFYVLFYDIIMLDCVVSVSVSLECQKVTRMRWLIINIDLFLSAPVGRKSEITASAWLFWLRASLKIAISHYTLLWRKKTTSLGVCVRVLVSLMRAPSLGLIYLLKTQPLNSITFQLRSQHIDFERR